MSDDREFLRATTDWLEAGSDQTPPQAIDAVLLAIRTTRQERVLWSPWRTLDMALFARVAIGAAAVLAVALAAITLGPLSNGPGAAPTPSPTPTPTPALTVDGPLEAGRYTFHGPYLGVPVELQDTYPTMSFTVPSGWQGGESGANLTKVYGDNQESPLFFVWNVHHGFVDPCTDHTPVMPAPDSGIDGLLETIVNQPGVSGGPIRDVTVGGYSGRAVDYTVTVDTTKCGNGDSGFWIWDSADSWVRWAVSMGEAERLYAIDVDGVTYTFFTRIHPDVSDADRAELEAIIDSIDIEP
jgi:hypothetical protein